MKQKKNLKRITVLLSMILCIFSVISLTSIQASAASKTNVSNAYLRTYSNGCTEVYMTISYSSSYKVSTSTNISWLVKRGASSNSIKMLQASLNTILNSNNLTVDGVWGPQTESALKSYQSWRLGTSQADGICGPTTWRTLVSDVNLVIKTDKDLANIIFK